MESRCDLYSLDLYSSYDCGCGFYSGHCDAELAILTENASRDVGGAVIANSLSAVVLATSFEMGISSDVDHGTVILTS
jgi:hypothetical protein